MTETPAPPADDAEDTGPVVRPFADLLRELAGGKVHNELSEAMPEVLRAVDETGKTGTVTLKLSISHIAEGQITVTADVAVKTPKFPSPSTFLFVDADFNATKSDPTQQAIPGLGPVASTDAIRAAGRY